jgi:large subunit ribosomal protein L30
MAKIKITLVKSRIGIMPIMVRTMDALGLKKQRQSVIVEETVQIKGMVAQVIHLIKVEQA